MLSTRQFFTFSTMGRSWRMGSKIGAGALISPAQAKSMTDASALGPIHRLGEKAYFFNRYLLVLF